MRMNSQSQIERELPFGRAAFDIKLQTPNISPSRRLYEAGGKHPMRILMISPEGPPLQRTGALIDVMNALPRELRERGHEVSVVLPHYREIRENTAFRQEEAGITVDVQVGDQNYVAEFVEGHTESGVQLFFIRCDT